MIKTNSNSTAVILVDMQDFFLEKFEKEKVKDLILNQNKVLELCEVNKIPLFVLEYSGRGKTVSALQKSIKKVEDVSVVVKENNSGFRDTNLDELLKNKGVKKIILMGINGSGCVQDTAIGALKRGYKIMTSRGVIASNTMRDANLATSKKWYSKNGKFFESVEDLLEGTM